MACQGESGVYFLRAVLCVLAGDVSDISSTKSCLVFCGHHHCAAVVSVDGGGLSMLFPHLPVLCYPLPDAGAF